MISSHDLYLITSAKTLFFPSKVAFIRLVLGYIFWEPPFSILHFISHTINVCFMKLAFQWYGFSHGQWCHFLLADMWFVFILHSYTWDLSEHSCLFPSFSSIMKLQGQGYVFYTFNRCWQIVSKMIVPSRTPTDTVMSTFFPRPSSSPDFTN